MWLVLLASVAHAACPEGRTEAELRVSLDRSKAAVSSGDLEAFDLAYAELTRGLGCLEDVAAPGFVQEVYLVQAFDAAVHEDRPRSEAAARALIRMDPTFTLEPQLAPLGHPLRAAVIAAREADAAESVALPAGEWVLDGQPAPAGLPLGEAALLQQLDAAGGTRTWVFSGQESAAQVLERLQAKPTEAASAGGTPRVSQDNEQTVDVRQDNAQQVEVAQELRAEQSLSAESRQDMQSVNTNVNIQNVERQTTPRSRTLLGVAASAAVVSGAAFFGAKLAEDAYYTQQASCLEDVDGARCADPGALRPLNNGLFVTGVVMGVGAAGLGVGAVLTWDW